MQEIKCSWAYSRDAVAAAMEALDEATEALEQARAVCAALRQQMAEDALREWDKLFPEYRER